MQTKGQSNESVIWGKVRTSKTNLAEKQSQQLDKRPRSEKPQTIKEQERAKCI
jgi:hypothetical protein